MDNSSMLKVFTLLYYSITVASPADNHQITTAGECETINLLNVVPYPDSGEFAGWDRGLEVIPAGHLATRHINSRADLLNGKNIRIINVASEACERRANDGFVRSYGLIVRTSCIHGVIGLFCSSVTNMMLPLLSHPQYGYVILSSSTSPFFHSEDYPYLFQNIASSAVFNKAMIALMDSFNWTRTSIIFDSMAFYFKSTGSNFAELISQSTNKELLSTLPILHSESDISGIFAAIDNRGSRVGYYSVTVEESASIMCEAYRQHHLWPSYVYVFHERTVEEMLSANVGCTRDEMIVAIEGIFSLQYRLRTMNTSTLFSGTTYQEYYREYSDELHEFSDEIGMRLQENEYANSLYDQIWAFAIALNQSLESNSIVNSSFEATYEATPNLRKELTKNLRNLSFEGVTGLIRYGPQQEVQTFVDIIQVSNGRQNLIGVFNSYNKSISFVKELHNVPGDSFKTEPHLVPKWLAALVLVAQSGLFILITLNTILLIYLRNEPEIKSSSLYISLIILAGCFLLCLSPVFYTAHAAFSVSDTTTFTLLCNMELWFSINGLSIVFVSLLFRLIRIFHVFRSFHSTGKYWSDQYLILYIFLASSVAVVLLLVHTVTDPVRQYTETTYVNSDPPFYHHHAFCSSNLFPMWTIIMFSWLGLIMILVVFLAIQTRHIKRKHFKDTKKVSILVFCVCAIIATFIPLSHILFASYVLLGAYLLKWLAFFMVSLLCQLFLFLPKIYPILYSSTRKSRSKPYASALVRTAVRGTKL